MELSELCYLCRHLKDPSLGQFEKVPGRCHDRRFVCAACREKRAARPWRRGRDREPSPLERQAKSALLESDYLFEQEYQLGKLWFDFAIPTLRLLVEVDGKHWHAHPSRRKRDRMKSAIAAKAGWAVARVQLPDLEGKVAAALHRRSAELGEICPGS